MVLEKEDSGVCLSTQPGSPISDDPAEGRKLSGFVDQLERLRTLERKMEGGEAGEVVREGKEESRWATEGRGLRVNETEFVGGMGKEEREEDGSNVDERRREGGGRAVAAGVRCHHHLLLTSEDQDDETEARICPICRKKEERLQALRRAIGDDQLDREDSPAPSPWSPTIHPSSPNHQDTRSPSLDSPSSTAGSDHFDQLSSSSSVPSLAIPKKTPMEGRSNSQHKHAPSATNRLPSASSHSPADQSIAGHSGHSSPRDSVSGQQQQALIQRLQGALSKMTPRDQKILALMLAKKEAEERQRNLRELAHNQWEEEMMKKTTMARGDATNPMKNNDNTRSSMRRRRNTGGEAVTLRNKDKLAAEMKSDDGAGSEPQTPCSAHGTSHPTSPLDDRQRGRGPENLDKGQRPTKSCLDLPQQKSREKQIQAMERKKSVEQRLEQQKREMEEHLAQLKRKQEQDLQRANSVRMSKEQKQILRAKLKNLEAQQKQERISQLKRQSMVDLSQKQEEIQSRLSKAELKVQQLRHEEARKKREDLERKIDQSRLRQEQIEIEQKQWQDELLKYQKWKDYQADGLAKETVVKKRESACVERIQREKLQRENMKRLLNQEEQWLNDVEATIAMKDARIRTVQKEKEEQIQRSRAMASASQRMREELKLHYSMNDLDQVTRQVVLENRLVSKGQQNGGGGSRLTSPPSHNASSLTLGCVDEV